jgi:SPP1 gp7 family putative phage head morphogenesis protein
LIEGIDIENLLKDFYSGRISLSKLPKVLYNEYLSLFGKSIEELGIVSSSFEASIYENIRLFSGAKTFQYSYSTLGNLYNEAGKLLSLSEFIEAGKTTFNLYNETWLKTEYEFALSQAEAIKTWNEETSINDYLEYVAVLDSKTSAICKPLDGIVRHKTDSFWVTHSPLNHYQCRCVLMGSDGHNLSSNKATNTAIKDSKVTIEMQYNPALTAKIFDKSHPYFDVPKLYKSDLNKNFGL